MAETMPEKEKQMHLTDYLRVVWRRWALVLMVWVLIVAVVVVVTFMATPLYRISTQVEVQQKWHLPAVFSGGQGMTATSATEEFYQTQYANLRSYSLIEAVYNDPGLRLSELPMLRRYKDRDPVEILSSYFGVTPRPKTYIAEVWMLWPNRIQGALILNKLTAEYQRRIAEKEKNVADRIVTELTARVDNLTKNIEDAQSNIRTYRQQWGIYSPSPEVSALLGKQGLLIKQVAEARQKLMDVEADRNALQDMINNGQAVVPDVQHDYLDALRIKLQNYQEQWEVQKIQTSQRTREWSQTDQIYQKMIETLQKDIAVELKRLQDLRWNDVTSRLAQVDTNYQRLLKEQTDLEPTVVSYQFRLFELENMQKQEDLYRDITEALKKAQEQMTLSRNVEEVSVRVETADPPPENQYYTPRYALNIGLGLAVGLFLGIGAAYFAEYLNTTIRLPRDIEEVLGLPLLGFVPAMPSQLRTLSNRGMVTHLNSQGGVAEAYRGIRTELLLSCPSAQGCKTYMVTSTSPMEGKTTVSCNLAITMAQAGNRVLLIDADVRKPMVHKVFDLENEQGLATLLAETGEARVYIKKTMVENLHVLPGGPPPHNPAELLGSRKMRTLVAEAAERYDIVIVDSAPVLGVADANIVATMVDSVLLVIQSSRVRRGHVLRARNQLTSVNAHLIGAVLNNVRGSRGDYYYYHRYYSPTHVSAPNQEQPVG